MAMVPLLGMLAQLLAWWIRVPSILLLLTFGIALGFWMNPDHILEKISGDPEMGAKIVFPFVSLAVAVILFEGGLSLRFDELKQAAGGAIIRLCTIGVLISWVLGSLLAWGVLGIQLKLAILLAAVLVVTGPTVITPLLRHIRPNRKIGSVVKWEGIIIDPIGAILAVLVFEQLFHVGHQSPDAVATWEPLLNILKTAAIGLGFGCLASFGLVEIVKRYWMPDYLHGLAFLSTALAMFAASNWLMHESGLVTVTVMGIYLANQKQISIEHVVEFKENLGVFLISCLFIVLGSRLDLTVMGQVGWRGAIFVLLMIAVVRPLSILGSMWKSGLNRKEQMFLAFLAPRGIVAAAVVSVFALRILATAGQDEELIRDAQVLVPATFMLIIGTVAVYGLGAAPLARKLGLADANPQGILFAGATAWIRDVAATLMEAGYPVVLIDTNYQNISAAKMKNLPAHCKSILSDYVCKEVNLAGIGRMFALTKNDAINSMAAQEFSHLFGSKNVFRLKRRDEAKGDRAKVGHSAKGRELFADAWNQERLQQVYEQGFRPKLTKMSKEFTFEDFQALNGNDVIVLMVIDKKGVITVNTADFNLEPTEEQSVLALVKP
ncbi:MAG: NhaP-type Na+/H+ or K+/H+ antiporter [Mariniblastus sp.]|jgi:NhaP-type Na+/H+ or K+/H+ antiporter